MGLRLFLRSCSRYDQIPPQQVVVTNMSAEVPSNQWSPNPDPENFVILRDKQVGKFLILEVQYPGCINYEGIKILLLENVTLESLKAHQKVLDPHFSNSGSIHHPIARFEPTKRGWAMAESMAEMMARI